MPRPHDPPSALVLGGLAPYDGTPLQPRDDHDDTLFDSADLSDRVADGASFLGCRLAGCRADGLRARRARFVDTELRGLQAATLDLAESTWRDCILADCRLGAVTASRAQLSRVRVRGGKVDFVNLRGARLLDVVFESCVLGELDAGDAELVNVSFVDARLDVLRLSGSTADRLDLRGARLSALHGLDNLRGTVVTTSQLLDLAPALAAHLGITVAD